MTLVGGLEFQRLEQLTATSTSKDWNSNPPPKQISWAVKWYIHIGQLFLRQIHLQKYTSDTVSWWHVTKTLDSLKCRTNSLIYEWRGKSIQQQHLFGLNLSICCTLDIALWLSHSCLYFMNPPWLVHLIWLSLVLEEDRYHTCPVVLLNAESQSYPFSQRKLNTHYLIITCHLTAWVTRSFSNTENVTVNLLAHWALNHLLRDSHHCEMITVEELHW